MWQRYNEAFWDEDTAMGNCKWSVLDPQLYNKIRAGQARKVLLEASSPATDRGAGPPPKRTAQELGRLWGGKSGVQIQHLFGLVPGGMQVQSMQIPLYLW